jgi:Na+-translocating ferredoxin:NAD+ oxidoreductase RnfE subunit
MERGLLLAIVVHLGQTCLAYSCNPPCRESLQSAREGLRVRLAEPLLLVGQTVPQAEEQVQGQLRVPVGLLVIAVLVEVLELVVER